MGNYSLKRLSELPREEAIVALKERIRYLQTQAGEKTGAELDGILLGIAFAEAILAKKEEEEWTSKN